MGNNKFKYIQDGVETEIRDLQKAVEEYNNSLLELKQLIEEISTSTLWKDEEIKTAFIDSSLSYIEIYEELKNKINNRISYLKGKSSLLNKIDIAYKRWLYVKQF